MPKNVPAEFIGRFSIKPKKSRSKLKATPSGRPAQDDGTSPVPEYLRDELMTFHERKRKALRDGSETGGPVHSAIPSLKDDEDRIVVDEDGLNVYYQVLQEQSPNFKRSSHYSDQSDQSEQQPSSSTQQLRIHEKQSPGSDGEKLLTQEKALWILEAAWSTSSGFQFDVSATAQRLAQHIAVSSCPTNSEEVLQKAVLAIVESSSRQPRGIDFLLHVFDEATKLLSHPRPSQAGLSPELASQQLKGWLRAMSIGFRGTTNDASVGTIDLEDRSNIKFRYPDVSANLTGVVERVRNWKKERQIWIVAAAMHARCLSLDIASLDNGKHALTVVDAGLDRRHHKWSKADMVGACILLRGCAKSLIESLAERGIKDRQEGWTSLLESFLLQDSETWDNDFVIKTHAAVSSPEPHQVENMGEPLTKFSLSARPSQPHERTYR